VASERKWPLGERGLCSSHVRTVDWAARRPSAEGGFQRERKPEQVGGEDPVVTWLAALRLIINLTASNEGQSNFASDVPLLPFIHQ
jgi:hypothetical protein